MDKQLHTKYIGKKIIYYNNLDSTQKEIWRRIENGNIENGTLIMADIQTDGIGTHGRKWSTTKKGNIAFSFVIIPNTLIDNLKNITINIAEIIVDVFKKLYKIEINIKYPNDLIINGKKVGGILTQTKLQGDIVKYIVIGIGINTNEEETEEKLSTSIKKEFNIEIDNKNIIFEFCNKFEQKLLKMLGE